MNYNLAKKLKDAGFKSVGLGTYTSLFEGELMEEGKLYPSSKLEQVYIPTLSELIEACGDVCHDFTFHLENTKDNIRWWAEMRNFGSLVKQTQGETPIEAVANLYLELHKK